MLASRSLFWITPLALALHIVEELAGGFPEWATRHFGTTTTGFFVLSHVPLVAAVAYIAYRAATADNAARWAWMAVMVQWALGVNGLFHLATTLLFREYSPGVVTGVLLYVPITAYFLNRVRVDAFVRGAQVITACIGGTVISVLLVLSLWLDLDFV